MIVTIGQPGLFPWWGTFAKAAISDVVVHLDHVSWQKGGYLNRFRVAEGRGPASWCTIPLERPMLGTPITEVRARDPREWLQVHAERLDRAGPASHELAHQLLRETYLGEATSLSGLAERSTELVASALGLTTSFVRSADLAPSGSSTPMLLGLLRSLGADTYVFGPGRRGLEQHYLDIGMLQSSGVRVGVARYADHPRMSILRDIANRGVNALENAGLSIEWLE